MKKLYLLLIVLLLTSQMIAQSSFSGLYLISEDVYHTHFGYSTRANVLPMLGSNWAGYQMSYSTNGVSTLTSVLPSTFTFVSADEALVVASPPVIRRVTPPPSSVDGDSSIGGKAPITDTSVDWLLLIVCVAIYGIVKMQKVNRQRLFKVFAYYRKRR